MKRKIPREEGFEVWGKKYVHSFYKVVVQSEGIPIIRVQGGEKKI